jgi:hypothetical protein
MSWCEIAVAIAKSPERGEEKKKRGQEPFPAVGRKGVRRKDVLLFRK